REMGEPEKMLPPAGRPAPPHLVAPLGVAPEGFLAEDVLAGFGSRDRRFGMDVIRPAVVEEPDLRVGDELAPVRRPALVAVALRGLCDGLFVPPGDRDQPRRERARPGPPPDLPTAVP